MPQFSQFKPIIPSFTFLPTQVGPIFHVPAGGFTFSSHCTPQSREVKPFLLLPLPSLFQFFSFLCLDMMEEMAGLAYVQMDFPSLVVATPWANTDWQ